MGRIEPLLNAKQLRFLGLFLLILPSRVSAAETAPQSAVVLELFTSQGCSICPAADKLLSELAQQPSIIPLAYHVDYWNELGWADPFSDPAWSKRQQEYAPSLPSGQFYTPQLVVNGQRECIGSDKGCIEQAIQKAKPSAVSLLVEVGASNEQALTVDVYVRAAALKSFKSKNYQCVAVLTEDGLQTAVKRGENSGRQLVNDGVVRRLGAVKLAKAPDSAKVHFELQVKEEWKKEQVHLVVFLQEVRTKEIVAAVKIPLKLS